MTTDKHVNQFLNEQAEREKLVDEIMLLAEQVAEKKPELLDGLVMSIVPEGYSPTKPN